MTIQLEPELATDIWRLYAAPQGRSIERAVNDMLAEILADDRATERADTPTSKET